MTMAKNAAKTSAVKENVKETAKEVAPVVKETVKEAAATVKAVAAEAKEAVKKDYEERREIMDASPIHVAIAGRMMFKRVMGKASFCNIQDLQGNIQVYVARDAIGTDSYADFKKSDIGDIFGLEGFAFRTRTGEISIHASLKESADPSGEVPRTDKYRYPLSSEICGSYHEPGQQECIHQTFPDHQRDP